MASSSIHVVAHGTSDGLYGRVGGCHLTTLTAGCGSSPMCVCRGQPSTCRRRGSTSVRMCDLCNFPCQRRSGKETGGGGRGGNPFSKPLLMNIHCFTLSLRVKSIRNLFGQSSGIKNCYVFPNNRRKHFLNAELI